tara:strand:- start:608 stop:787 length:180 start_codon:yes stop_codon:yes gene_type:complete
MMLLALLIASLGCSDNGASLYLAREAGELKRAEFVYAKDCRLIAKTMREADPRTNWYCR